MLELLKEAKGLNVYKKLLKVMGEYTDKFPATGVSKMLKQAIETGMKILPKDKRALDILNTVLYTDDSVPAAITRLLNLRFADIEIGDGRPIYKNGKVKEVAFWSRGGKVYDKILSFFDKI